MGEVINQELRLAGYKNIKVTTIEPWAADTPWWGHAANYSGGTPRMKAMDNPNLVVDVMIWSYFHPRKEIPLGPKAKTSYFFHHLAPHFTEKLSANYSHKYQIRFAPPAKDTTGTLYTPMESGRGIDDGVRQRIKKEKEERKRKNN
ncbi:short-chain dehydrogenase/reductase SDR [Sporocytophaga myxococcoides]|uniref:Short-chain dehydrogenase/reductase SDR n=1 Tax=Sporocytophaga myxococcoides TaxID=153721 RepID=A0A098LGJ8_9BACT|nr:short-chain dehydrogenase/reductase SDR [Sporocytophaga myxococcoides]